jgi:hypothetical protein
MITYTTLYRRSITWVNCCYCATGCTVAASTHHRVLSCAILRCQHSAFTLASNATSPKHDTRSSSNLACRRCIEAAAGAAATSSCKSAIRTRSSLRSWVPSPKTSLHSVPGPKEA